MKKVPESELQKVEEARKLLYKYLEEVGFFKDDVCNIKLLSIVEITQPLWRVANRKWEDVR